jgi:KaiC/GvpD/RAD55 family RecA-like ATPase/5S rRNA maturation endonuclease (ribonuclease M5)
MNTLGEAKHRDIRQVAAELGFIFGRGHKQAYCPDHSRGPGKGTPSVSFFVKDGHHRFKCHGCQKSGDSIDMVSWIKSCETREAISWLNGKTLNDSKASYPPLQPEAPEVPVGRRIAACSAFHAALGKMDDFGVDWLLTQRGIKPETVVEYKLTDITKEKATRAMGAAIQATDVDTCVALGIAAKSKSSENLFCPVGFAYHIAIPYLTDKGSVAHLQFRRVSRSGENDKGPKYRHLRGQVPMPYNLPSTQASSLTNKGKSRVFLVEGALDALSLSQMGVSALGIPGVGWLDKSRTERILRRLKDGTEVVLGFDADDAGRSANSRCVDMFQEVGVFPLSVTWPSDFAGDWCDWFRERPNSAPDISTQQPTISETEAWIGDIMEEGTADVVAVASGAKVSKQVKTGYSLLDSLLHIEPGDMVVVAARPSTGKSHFVLSLMQRMATRFGTKSMFVSLEMSKPSVAKRISAAQMGLGQDTKVPLHELEVVARKANRAFSDLPILVDFGNRKMDRVIENIRSSVKKHGLEMVVIDYLQLLECKGRNRQEEVADASRRIKALSNELLVPIITVVQMNRDIEKRTGSVPQMSDLRESGQIEQDADSILFVDRPFVRDPNANFSDFNIRISKQRNGSTGRLTMHLPEPFGWLQDREFDTRNGNQ